MKAIFFTLFLSIITFFLVIGNQERKAILISIFMLFIFWGRPIENQFIHTGILIEIAGCIIFTYWVALKFKKNNFQKYNINLKELSPKITSLYYFLFIGILLGCIYFHDETAYLEVIIRQTPLEQIINNSINIILVIILIKILSRFQYDDLIRSKMAKVVIFTIFIHVFSQILKALGMENILWNLFSARGTFDVEEVRNVGLYYSFGLGVYVVLIISFSLLYYKRHKFLSIAAMLFAFIFSIFTGALQTIVFTALFVAIIIFIHTLKRKLPLSIVLVIIVLSIGFTIIYNNFLINTVLFRRFTPAISYIDQGDILMASNRETIGIPFVLDEFKTYPILGKGLLNLYDSKNTISNVAGHVIWFNIYKKFGIIGVIYLLTIIVYPIIKLYKIIKRTKDKYVIKEGAILFSLMIIVFVQQFWDNFFWFSNTMLLYAFIYFWVFSFFNRQKLLSKEQ